MLKVTADFDGRLEGLRMEGTLPFPPYRGLVLGVLDEDGTWNESETCLEVVRAVWCHDHFHVTVVSEDDEEYTKEGIRQLFSKIGWKFSQ